MFVTRTKSAYAIQLHDSVKAKLVLHFFLSKIRINYKFFLLLLLSPWKCIYVHIYAHTEWVHWVDFAFSCSNLNSREDTDGDETGNKEWRQLPEGKDTFHEDSLASVSWKQEILGNQCWLEKIELSLGRWANTDGHEWKKVNHTAKTRIYPKPLDLMRK